MPGVRVYDTGRLVRRVPGSGIQVVEYMEEPGVYYTISGDVIDNEDWPLQAGFDVVASRKEKRRRELMIVAQRMIDKQIAEEEAGVEAKIEDEEAARKTASENDDPAPEQQEVHVQKGASLQAVHRGAGKYRVEDAAGDVIADGLTKQDADQFISDAAAAEAEEAASGG